MSAKPLPARTTLSGRSSAADTETGAFPGSIPRPCTCQIRGPRCPGRCRNCVSTCDVCGGDNGPDALARSKAPADHVGPGAHTLPARQTQEARLTNQCRPGGNTENPAT